MKDFSFYLNSTQEIGYVEKITSSIIYASGLPRSKLGEMVIFDNENLGQISSLSPNFIEILVFPKNPVKPGMKLVRTNEFLKIPVGWELLGNVISPLGISLNPLNSKRSPSLRRAINNPASGILTRKTIKKQLETGVSLVDLVIPLGYGQRELIIGDRKTGKTNFLLQSVLTQAKKNNICVYAAIGKRKLDIKELKDFFVKQGVFDQVVIVASGSEDPTGIIYLTPYSAMTISEYFRDEGNNVFLVLDDLSTHAKFYREISLLGKRFPGRNSYPGDIFYIHSSLLERAGNFVTPKGEKAITCFPVAETMQGDLSGYIETNLMSMTDGHLYFDADLFAKGRRPAINPFLSVTRVGRQTQSNLKRELNREVLSFITLFEKMQNFTHFGAELSVGTRATLGFGEKIIEFFKQNPSTTIPINLQIILFSILWNNIIKNKESQDKSQNTDTEKLAKLYEKNEDVRKKIDSMIEDSKSFNELLGIIRQKGEKMVANILKYAN